LVPIWPTVDRFTGVLKALILGISGRTRSGPRNSGAACRLLVLLNVTDAA
jgi:hypothetical protein